MSAAGQPQPLIREGETPRYPAPDWDGEGLRLNIMTAAGETACIVAYQSPDRIATVSTAAPSSPQGQTARQVWEALTIWAAQGLPAAQALTRLQETQICAIDSSRDLSRIVADLSGVS